MAVYQAPDTGRQLQAAVSQAGRDTQTQWRDPNLGVPTTTDRLIQQEVQQVLSAYYDPTFSEHSYGFRPGRSAHQAIEQALSYVNDGYSYIVDIDLEKFFDTAGHDYLMNLLDKELEKRGHRFVRYADDCCIYVRSLRAGERALASITRFIETELHLGEYPERRMAYCPQLRTLGHDHQCTPASERLHQSDEIYSK